VTGTSVGSGRGSSSHPIGSAPPAPWAESSPATRHHWFEDLADHVGAAYERYSFTRGTDQEVDFLVEALGLGPATIVLDLGCGTGRHARALRGRLVPAVGVDVAARFVALAAAGGVPVVRGDARRLPVADASVDAVVSLCQGGFGLTGGPAAASAPAGVEPDEVVLDEVRRVLRHGGRVALTAFSSYFAVRDIGDDEGFDAEAGVLHERTQVRDEEGRSADHDLWTTCYTPRELRLLLAHCGLEVEHVWSVRPGRYAAAAPSLDSPEYLAVGRRPR
jgi:SAM-dependent methyltransferase